MKRPHISVVVRVNDFDSRTSVLSITAILKEPVSELTDNDIRKDRRAACDDVELAPLRPILMATRRMSVRGDDVPSGGQRYQGQLH